MKHLMKVSQILKAYLQKLLPRLKVVLTVIKLKKVGEEIQKSLDGRALQDASVKRKDMDKTLENLKSGVIIEKEMIHIDSVILFARLMLILHR